MIPDGEITRRRQAALPSHDPLAWIDAEADAWSLKGLERRLAVLGGSQPGQVVQAGRPLLNFSSNDYLGLANHPALIEAAIDATRRYGWGTGASPLISGWREPHEALAVALSRFEGVEAVALFGSGFAANLGAITALVGPGDAVYVDRLNHASIIDGVRLAGARTRVYPHSDADRLEALLQRDQGRFRRSMIATDAVFSMDGDLAPLVDLVDLADRFGAMLLVDEAHGTGVYGTTGRGATEAAGIAPERIAIKVGTLSKALGSIGGFVAGSRRLISRLHNHARSLIYSTAPPSAAAAAASRALEVIRAEPQRRLHLQIQAARLRSALGVPDSDPLTAVGPIVPWVVGTSQAATTLSAQLLDAGCLVPAIRPPTVPAGTARLRFSLTAGHTPSQVDRLIAAIANSSP